VASGDADAPVPPPDPAVPLAVEPAVEIKVRDDGPYKITGAVRLIDAQGNELSFDAGRPLVLCRCGHSHTKPFCDASHKVSGFESCVRARAIAGRRT